MSGRKKRQLNLALYEIARGLKPERGIKRLYRLVVDAPGHSAARRALAILTAIADKQGNGLNLRIAAMIAIAWINLHDDRKAKAANG